MLFTILNSYILPKGTTMPGGQAGRCFALPPLVKMKTRKVRGQGMASEVGDCKRQRRKSECLSNQGGRERAYRRGERDLYQTPYFRRKPSRGNIIYEEVYSMLLIEYFARARRAQLQEEFPKEQQCEYYQQEY